MILLEEHLNYADALGIFAFFIGMAALIWALNR